MENQNETSVTQNNKWLGIVITQVVCVSIILLSLILMKYFWHDTFDSVKKWYEINICNDTDVNEVLQSGGDNDEI